jgi:hypothetical protein
VLPFGLKNVPAMLVLHKIDSCVQRLNPQVPGGIPRQMDGLQFVVGPFGTITADV